MPGIDLTCQREECALITVTSVDEDTLAVSCRVVGLSGYLSPDAIIELAHPGRAGVRGRFTKALVGSRGSLLISLTDCARLGAVADERRTSIRALLNGIGVNWAFLQPDPDVAFEREKDGRTGDGCLSHDLLEAFALARRCVAWSGPGDGQTTSLVDWLSLDAVIDWIAANHTLLTEHEAIDQSVSDTYAQFQATHRSGPAHFERVAKLAYDCRWPATFALSHLTRQLILEDGTRPLTREEARGLRHAGMTAAYGSFAVLDASWKARVESLPQPNELARLYLVDELDRLVADLEAYAGAMSSLDAQRE